MNETQPSTTHTASTILEELDNAITLNACPGQHQGLIRVRNELEDFIQVHGPEAVFVATLTQVPPEVPA